MQTILETAVVLCLLFAIIALIAWRVHRVTLRQDARRARRAAAAIAACGSLLAIACCTVGLLYRLHDIGERPAAILYAPLVVLFFVGLHFLQPYVRYREEDSDHER
jgi:uncharacterized membrane protein